mmetsp:Transcript_118481/g.360440  ORF Transcript_118481/g.360440 Transcript_118481/m.360440 type:complete len:92 (+) Transcript_118481:47-322(+)
MAGRVWCAAVLALSAPRAGALVSGLLATDPASVLESSSGDVSSADLFPVLGPSDHLADLDELALGLESAMGETKTSHDGRGRRRATGSARQ